MFPVWLDPIDPASGPGDVFCVSPWTGAHPEARPGDRLRLVINSRLLRDDGSALVLEPPHGGQLYVSSVVYSDPGYGDLIIISLRATKTAALPTPAAPPARTLLRL